MHAARPRSVTRWFSPRLVAFHVFSLAAIAAMLAAGFWQWNTYRDHQEQASEQAQEALASAAPVSLTSVFGRDDPFPADSVGRRVRVTGEYSTRQFFVKDKVDHRHTGLWVLTPLRVDSGSAILVVRGWLPDASSPAAAVPTGRVTVVGALEPPESTISPLSGEPRPGAVITSISPALLVGVLPFDLYSGYLVATSQQPPDAPGLVAVAPPTADSSPWSGLRHALYAVQWALFAGFGTYMWWRICRDLTQVA
jgi:surfeit locus 1 family protein